jgi:hypothetical protein
MLPDVILSTKNEWVQETVIKQPMSNNMIRMNSPRFGW